MDRIKVRKQRADEPLLFVMLNSFQHLIKMSDPERDADPAWAGPIGVFRCPSGTKKEF